MFRGLEIAQVRIVVALLLVAFGIVVFHRWQNSGRMEIQAAAVSGNFQHHPAGVLTPEFSATDENSERPQQSRVSSPVDPQRPATGLSAGGLIDLNEADAQTLELLPGIGPSKAKAIVEERNLNGPFQNVDELARTKGIGEKTVESLRPYVTLSLTHAPSAPGRPTEVLTTQAPTTTPAAVAWIRINHANAADLQQMKGVGPKLAESILAHRAVNGSFQQPDDLLAVKGIGPKILEQNRHKLLFD